MKYAKVAIPLERQLARWKQKGLVVDDEAEALHALTYIGYFRLRGYALPFMRWNVSGTNRDFMPGTRFEEVLELYDFDRSLRAILLSQLEPLEVAARTVISNTMSERHGPFWYLDPSGEVFKPEFDASEFLEHVESETMKSSDIFVRHYFQKYSEPHIPPSWIVAECLSFGVWSRLYKNLLDGKTPIAKRFDLPVDVFQSWLHGLSILRNTCAHNGRVWNRRIPQRPKVLNKISSHMHGRIQQIYCFSAMIQYVNRRVNPNASFAKDLSRLFASYPKVQAAEMGFSEDWEYDELWQP